MKEDGTFEKIKKAESLRGKIVTRPTDSSKAALLNCYKTLEEIIFLEPHKKLQEEVFEVQKIKQALDEEGRAPSDEEVKKIANFN